MKNCLHLNKWENRTEKKQCKQLAWIKMFALFYLFLICNACCKWFNVQEIFSNPRHTQNLSKMKHNKPNSNKYIQSPKKWMKNILHSQCGWMDVIQCIIYNIHYTGHTSTIYARYDFVIHVASCTHKIHTNITYINIL